ncbi:hypothetical protein J4G37_02415 [Microvirga sp. 3-52]|nr:hypothetical protein [Microvirga sp. 3-52]
MSWEPGWNRPLDPNCPGLYHGWLGRANPPWRHAYSAAEMQRAAGGDGLPGGNAPRHGRACSGHPDRMSAALFLIGITGTRPVMTSRR